MILKKNFDITGMNCAACSARVEKAVSAIDGVESCSVNLLTNSMTVETDVESDVIVSAVENAGYGAAESGRELRKTTAKQNVRDDTFKVLRSRLIFSVAVLAILMYISMGHVMWGWPLPFYFSTNPVATGLLELILSAIIMIANQKFFTNGFKALLKGSPNMDTLVSLGSGASFVYSTCVLFDMTNSLMAGDLSGAHNGLHMLYFESAAMIVALITVGKMLESYSKGKTTSALEALINLAPQKATVLRDGKETTVSISELNPGDIFVVKPGEAIPADGVVTEGTSSVDESSLTGESIPVDKLPGNRVSAATINKYGHLVCKATAVGEETSLSKIIKLVTEASSGKAPIAKIADRVSAVFVPIVLIIAVITVIGWLWAGKYLGYALARGISVLVISCPCALGLATPVAIMVGSGVGAKNGILFKTAESLEQTGKVKICVFDKTGTVTKGIPKVTDVVPTIGTDVSELVDIAYSLEKMSEHPLAGAIVEYGNGNGARAFEISDFIVHPGNGLSASLLGQFVAGGKKEYISGYASVDADTESKAEECASKGKTPLFFVRDKKLLGFIAVADTLKDDSKEAISQIKKLGIKTVMLTGDNRHTAESIAKECGIDSVIAGLTPDEKEGKIRELSESGSVCMVGDGINDAPALTSADIGIAIGAGTDIAIDAADVVVTGSTISDVKSAIVLSRKTFRNIKENLFWAFIYNIIGIPLAAGLFVPFLGWELNPMIGAAAMSLSSFCVVSNALRLKLVKIKNDAGSSCNEKEKKEMIKTVKVEGLMCPHCEARVKKVLEALDGVVEVTASHEAKKVVITLSADVSDEVIKSTIENEGYTVINFE